MGNSFRLEAHHYIFSGQGYILNSPQIDEIGYRWGGGGRQQNFMSRSDPFISRFIAILFQVEQLLLCLRLRIRQLPGGHRRVRRLENLLQELASFRFPTFLGIC